MKDYCKETIFVIEIALGWGETLSPVGTSATN